MTYSNIQIETRGSISILTINRPAQLNALNKSTIEELHDALKAMRNDEAIRAIIITGSGEKAFVAGADIKEFADFSISEGRQLSAEGHRLLFDYLEQMNKPVIAAINGFALGGGLELAMACQIRIASENAKLGLPEVTLGVIPGYGGTQRLAQLAGKGKAMEMITTAGMISASEAAQCGLVNHVVPLPELISTCITMAEKIAKNSPRAIDAAIQAINAGYTTGVNGFEKEIEQFGACFGTADFKEGTQAFLEKRKPQFTGK